MIRLCFLLISLANTACSEQLSSFDNGNLKNMDHLNLYFNKETGAQFVARTQSNLDNPLPTSTTSFYELDWDENPINLVIEHGQHSIILQHVIGLQTSVANSNDLINSYSVYAGLTNDNTMSHEQARLKMLSIFKDLKGKGWQRFINLSSPRLTGKDAMEYAKKNSYALDPDYIYNFDEWMQLDNGSRWLFQADGIYLTIQIYRELSKEDPQKIGGYFTHYTFVSEKQHNAPYFRDEDLKKWEMNAARWVELYPGIKKENNRIREEKEAQLKAQGIKVDESYQDPPLVSKK